MEIFTFSFLGLLVGFVSHFFGIGGGSIIVPVLLWLKPQWSHPQIVFLSLLIVFINSLNNIRIAKFNQKISFELKSILFLSLGVLLGASSGGHFIDLIPPQYLKIILGSLLLISALKIFRKKNHQKNSTSPSWLGLPLGFIAGLIASLTGLGGGMLFIPILIGVYKVAFKSVPAHSNAMMLISSLSALLSQMYKSNLSFSYQSIFESAMILIVFSFIGSFISAKLDLNLSEDIKKMSLASLLSILSIRTLLSV